VRVQNDPSIPIIVNKGFDHDVRDFSPDTLDVSNFCLDTEFSFRSDFTGHLLDFDGEDGQLSNHVVDGVHEGQHLSRHGQASNLMVELAASDTSGRNSNCTHLECELEVKE
jgi:hypothetical protein